VLFSFFESVFGRGGQTLDEKLLLVGQLVPGFHPGFETIGANIAFSKTLHGVFAFKQLQFSILEDSDVKPKL
jgi:hypothetical protein